jgi:glyoxylase-like metal-dependent hydrolase (beta-lactamase superfamily II)
VRWILHTHLHIDHAGQDDHFPDSTTVVINRRELEFSVSGLMGEQYPAEYMKHLVDRLHTPGALRLLDLEMTGPEEIIPGVRCEWAMGHTDGSMNILVDTDEGTACICGDVIYSIQDQVVSPIYQVLEFEPQTTGNHSNTKRSEKAAIKKALKNTFVLPIHDFPARMDLKTGRVVSRLKYEVPGPEEPVDQKLPSELGVVVGV